MSNDINWYHEINLGDFITPGANRLLQNSLDTLFIPSDLSNNSVLDIGCWDGYYSFECEKRNASRVVAVDKYIWEKESNFWSKDKGFDFAHKHLNSKVEKVISNIEDLDPNQIGKFDYVLLLCLVCLAKNPIQYIEIAKSLSKKFVIIESHIDMLDVDFPAARYYAGKNSGSEVNDYWGMNPLAIVGIMEDLGFKDIEYKIIGDGNRAVFKGEV
jgi:tRNA (mo5U34)-methyltransferase